jgi:DNA-binding response OmpR family regulator
MRIRQVRVPETARARPSRIRRRAPQRASCVRGNDRILIVEDDKRIASPIEKMLRANGYATTVAEDGEAARSWLATSRFALVILDLGLPKVDGITVLQELRRDDPRTPVIILSGRDSTGSKVGGFEAGADDYMTKPFRFDELLARIRARVRDQEPARETALTVGKAGLDLLARRLVVGGRSVALTAREFSLAEVFFRNAGRVMSREQLLDQVWGYAYHPGSNVVDAHVSDLRRKLRVLRITSVRGTGYRLEPNGE